MVLPAQLVPQGQLVRQAAPVPPDHRAAPQAQPGLQALREPPDQQVLQGQQVPRGLQAPQARLALRESPGQPALQDPPEMMSSVSVWIRCAMY